LAPAGRDEAEHATDRGEGAARRQRTGERAGGFRLGQHGCELAGAGGGLGADGGDQPASTGGKRRLGMGAGVGFCRALARREARGKAGEGTVEAARGAGEVLPEGDDQGSTEGVAQEAAGDEGGESEQDGAEPVSEVGSGGAGGHGNYS
jgi:hypothetical protein